MAGETVTITLSRYAAEVASENLRERLADEDDNSFPLNELGMAFYEVVEALEAGLGRPVVLNAEAQDALREELS